MLKLQQPDTTGLKKNSRCSLGVDLKCELHKLHFPDVDQAVDSFSKLQKVDPYRLENMDTYSNLLYVKVTMHFDIFTTKENYDTFKSESRRHWWFSYW